MPQQGAVVTIALPSLPLLIEPEEDQVPALWRGAAAEFFATMIFIFVGTGTVVACQESLGSSTIGVPSLTLISLAHGFTIMVLVYAVGEISGGHINPAVTWACLFTGKISVLRAVIYIFSQLFGAIIGSSFLKSLLKPELQKRGMGCHGVNTNIEPVQGFGAEVIFTFIFIFVVFATAISPFAGKFSPLRGGESGKQHGPGKLTPFVVGATILILHTVGIPLTGASMNPARSFGPALVNNCWKSHWVYWFGPLLGSTVAAVVAQVIFLSTPRDIFRLNKTSMKEFTEELDKGKKMLEATNQTSSSSSSSSSQQKTTGLKSRLENIKEYNIPPPTALDESGEIPNSNYSPPKSKEPSPRVSSNNIPVNNNNVTTTTTTITTAPVEHDMHKSSSGQFSAIMQEDSDTTVELDDYN